MMKYLTNVMHSKFAKDIVTMQLGRLIIIACGLITSIAYVRFLGIGEYGKYATIMAFAGIFGIITNFGQQTTFLTFFAEGYGSNNKKQQSESMQYYFVTCATLVFILLVLGLISPSISETLYKDKSIGELARLIFLSSMFEISFNFISIILQITREIRFLTILENAKVLLQVVLAISLLTLGYGITGILISSLILSIVYFLISLPVYVHLQKKYNLPAFRTSIKSIDFGKVLQYAKSGFWIAIDKNIGNMYPTVFIFALSLIASLPVVGLIRLAFKLADVPASFALTNISKLSSSVIPTLAGKNTIGLFVHLRKLAIHSLFIHITFTIGGIILIPIFLPYVYGEDMKVAIYPFLVFTTLHITYAIHAMMTPIFRLKNKTIIPASINAIGMIIAFGFFFLSSKILRDTISLYVSLCIYHIIILSAIFPALRLIKNRSKPIQPKVLSS